MAKQTFTTGQVLTAAQMTSLQETAMGGGPATAKTASYVLVAADAGKTVAMNAAGATTITVNTGLFAAGDTVFIQNLGAGACTVTAGTATVATAGSAILPQNDAGILYFTATGASIFYDFIQVGAASPLTTKGDLYTFGTSDTRIGVGADGTTLVADSGEATGLKWQAPASGAMTLVQRSTFSNVANTGTTFDTVFTSTYKSYLMVIEKITAATQADDLHFQFRYAGPTTQTSYLGNSLQVKYDATTITNLNYNGATQITLNLRTGSSVNNDPGAGQFYINNAYGVTQAATINGAFIDPSNSDSSFTIATVDTSRIYTGFLLKSSSTNISGTVAIYGLA